ncbi:MAG: small basic family protein [Clostridia bacterium]|nr:small basic family protein [Clostridia bacterium]
MWLPLLGLIVGLLLGSIFTFNIPIEYANYLAVAVLAGLDSLLGGWNAIFKRDFDGMTLITGFFVNTLLAAGLAALGDMIGIDLYLAAVVAFGIRIFHNISSIRHELIALNRKRKGKRQSHGGIDQS